TGVKVVNVHVNGAHGLGDGCVLLYDRETLPSRTGFPPAPRFPSVSKGNPSIVTALVLLSLALPFFLGVGHLVILTCHSVQGTFACPIGDQSGFLADVAGQTSVALRQG